MTRDKITFFTDQLFNFAEDSYLERTSRPVYAAVFLLPFIIIYELGTIFINTDLLAKSQVRVVAFVWLKDFLQYLGFDSKMAYIAPPLAVLVILFSLQLSCRKKWSFDIFDIGPMGIECGLLAVPLIVLSIFLNSAQFSSPDVQAGQYAFENPVKVTVCENSVEDSDNRVSISGNSKTGRGNLIADMVTGIGAGIYEELIFRLVMIGILMIVFQDLLKFSHTHSIIFSVLISAALFSAHHHIVFIDGQFGQSIPFNWTEFFFRTVAGVYFAGLFAIRGFGIAAGTHALYDILAVILNHVFFQ